jgi:hypothetical protein
MGQNLPQSRRIDPSFLPMSRDKRQTMVDMNIAGSAVPMRPAFRPAEAKYLALSVAIFVAVVVLAELRNQAIAWDTFFMGYFSSLGLLAVGVYIRLFKSADRLSALTIALAGYALFGISMGIFFHVFMPRPDPVWDAFLLRFDHFFGYHWPDAVAWLAREYAWVGVALSYIYVSSFGQLICLIVLLGATGRLARLDLLLMTGMTSLLLTFAVWQMFPNFTMGMHYPIPSEAEQAIQLFTNTGYGAMLKDAALNGIPVISNDRMLGVVAFPSYHTVMMMLVVWFVYGTIAFWPTVALNIPMIPAIHIHGAHHILDFVGGIVVFFAALWLSKKLLSWRSAPIEV